jgi:hypothetical protein
MKYKIVVCDICGEKGPSEIIQLHDAFYICGRCSIYCELHPGVVFKSLRRFLTGNVL